MGIFDDEMLSINCPTCGKGIQKKVSWYKAKGQTCPFGCGTLFNTEEFVRSLQDAEKMWDQFRRKLGSTKLNIKL